MTEMGPQNFGCSPLPNAGTYFIKNSFDIKQQLGDFCEEFGGGRLFSPHNIGTN